MSERTGSARRIERFAGPVVVGSPAERARAVLGAFPERTAALAAAVGSVDDEPAGDELTAWVARCYELLARTFPEVTEFLVATADALGVDVMTLFTRSHRRFAVHGVAVLPGPAADEGCSTAGGLHAEAAAWLVKNRTTADRAPDRRRARRSVVAGRRVIAVANLGRCWPARAGSTRPVSQPSTPHPGRPRAGGSSTPSCSTACRSVLHRGQALDIVAWSSTWAARSIADAWERWRRRPAPRQSRGQQVGPPARCAEPRVRAGWRGADQSRTPRRFGGPAGHDQRSSRSYRKHRSRGMVPQLAVRPDADHDVPSALQTRSRQLAHPRTTVYGCTPPTMLTRSVPDVRIGGSMDRRRRGDVGTMPLDVALDDGGRDHAQPSRIDERIDPALRRLKAAGAGARRSSDPRRVVPGPAASVLRRHRPQASDARSWRSFAAFGGGSSHLLAGLGPRNHLHAINGALGGTESAAQHRRRTMPVWKLRRGQLDPGTSGQRCIVAPDGDGPAATPNDRRRTALRCGWSARLPADRLGARYGPATAITERARSVRLIKRLSRSGESMPLDRSDRVERFVWGAAATRRIAEGRQAFPKRPMRYRGR